MRSAHDLCKGYEKTEHVCSVFFEFDIKLSIRRLDADLDAGDDAYL
jgi:hypothetical protein